MTLFTPLGFLGLLSIVGLILIYIIKPNYQQKRVSSTYMWKLSLRYRKKRIPISKLRNVLLIICQVVILISCAVVLTQPNRILKVQIDRTEVIAIIDSSASMRTKAEDEMGNDETRFSRAINGVLNDFALLPQDGVMHVIVADTNAYFLFEEIRQENQADLSEALQKLLDEDKCSYGSADVEGAMSLCEEILQFNPLSQINFYTDTTYLYVPPNINVVNVCEQSEWNAAILDARAKIEQNHYVFYVDIALYGKDDKITVNLEVQDANAADSSSEGRLISFEVEVECRQDIARTIVFKYFNKDEEIPPDDEQTVYYEIENNNRVYAYQSVHISLNDKDSFVEDNSFDIYGGQKEILRVQYASTSANSFFNGILFVLQNAYKSRWDMKITEVKDGNPATQGFDFYIFEHRMPAQMPTDGVVFLVNPETSPSGSGFRISGEGDFKKQSVYLTEENSHPITSGVMADKITVSKYMRLVDCDPSYQVLMSCDGFPILLVQDEAASKIAVMSFSLHYSNLSVLTDFPRLMDNMFQYFLPATVVGNAFEVSEKISLMSRGSQLQVTKGSQMGGRDYEFNQTFVAPFPAVLITSIPGTYTLHQTTFYGKEVSEQIYLKIPAAESNIWKIEDNLDPPFKEEDDSDYFQDLLVFLAAVLVAVLLLEWILHNREEV